MMELYEDGGTPEGAEGMLPQAPEEAAQPTPEAPVQANAPEFNAQEWTLNYKGQPIIPKDPAHLKNLAQQGYDYSQKMEQFKRERDAWEAEKAKLSPYAELDQRFQKEPQLQQAIRDVVQKYETGQIEGGPDPQLSKFQQELEQIKQTQQMQKQKDEDMRLEKELDALKKQYGTYDWQTDDGEGTLDKKVLKYALENNISNVRAAFRDMMFDKELLSARANGLKESKVERQKQFKQGKVMPGQSTPPPAGKPVDTSKSYHDIANEAIAELQGK